MTHPLAMTQRGGSTEAVRQSIDERLTDLYSAHASGVRRMAYLMTGDADEAEDLLQEAFIRVGGRLLLLRDPERAAGYVYRTVMNLARDHGRRLRKEQELRQRLPRDVASPSPNFEARDQLWSALLKLRIRHRSVLFLRYYMDFSDSQTADVLGCSTSAVKSLVHRARQSLADHLQGEET